MREGGGGGGRGGERGGRGRGGEGEGGRGGGRKRGETLAMLCCARYRRVSLTPLDIRLLVKPRNIVQLDSRRPVSLWRSVMVSAGTDNFFSI